MNPQNRDVLKTPPEVGHCCWIADDYNVMKLFLGKSVPVLWEF